MKVLVTDGDARPALAIVRSLGRRGAAVLVGEERPVSLASSSRHCVRHVSYPSPYRDREAFERFLLEFVEREKVDVVMPVTDVTTYSVSRTQAALGRHAAVACPSFEAFDFVSDKWRLLQDATRCGVPVPRTEFVDGIAGLREVLHRVQYPAVVKPVRSRIPTDRGWRPTAVHYAYSEADLWRLFEETDYLTSSPSLIQERIVGPGLGVFVLFDRGEPVTAFAHRRLREKPPSGGVSVLRESVHLDPRLREQATRLLGPLGWHGVAMMEYKQDRRTGNLFLMEVNGRFWGSLQLAVDAGIDFPHQMCQLALGRRPGTAHAYRLGVKSRWLLGDLDHLLLRLFKRDRDLRLPDAAPSRTRTLLDFLKFADHGLHYEVLDRDDLLPFLYEIGQYVAALAGGAARCVGGRVARVVTAAGRSIGRGSRSPAAPAAVASGVLAHTRRQD
jgi:predicted ATP-grasp superfamily ATP-dependent carboligase